MRQRGFGWGKGRRVIKTVIAGDALQAALRKHQRYVDQHPHGCSDESKDWDARARFDAREAAPPAPLRMAKARLRSGRR